MRAAQASSPSQGPVRSLSVQFLERPAFGPLLLVPQTLRGGRSTAFLQVSARQEDRLLMNAAVTLGADGRDGEGHVVADRPDVRPPEDLAPLPLAPEVQPHFVAHADYRPAGGGFPFAGGKEARILIWMRTVERQPMDAAQLAFLFDAVFPAFYAVLTGPVPAASVDLRYDFAGDLDAPDGWVLFQFTTRDWQSGWAIEDATAWNREGRWLGVGRQLRKVVARGSALA